jgi:hypothetical protein
MDIHLSSFPARLRAIWLALRRSPRDRQARQNLPRLLLSLLPLFALVGWYVYFIHGAVADLGRDGLLVMGCSAGFGLLIRFVIAYQQGREQRAYDRDNPAVATGTEIEIYRETCLLATLLERLGSEVGMEKELPPNISVITRRVLLDRLTRSKCSLEWTQLGPKRAFPMVSNLIRPKIR